MDKILIDKELIIIGGGPAGLTAAIYAVRAKLDTLVLENKIIGGQIRNSYTIENYPGFEKISGADLADMMQNHAEVLGVEIEEFDEIESVKVDNEIKIVETENYIYKTKAIIIATGASPKKLPVPSEEHFSGRGIHYCAICDGAMYEDKIVAVVGGGNSALEEAVFLSRFAKKVIMIRRHNYFNGEKSTIEEINNNPKIEVLYNEDLIDVKGNRFVEKAVIKNKLTGEEKEIEVDAVFGYIGTKPMTDLFESFLVLNSQGYIVTDNNMNTNINGIFAAGDVREKDFRQITTAVGDGTLAALNAEKYIIEQRREK